MSNGYYHPTWQHVIGALATAYSIGCGYGITSPTLEFIKNENDKQFYASCINLGVIFGALFCGIILDKKTRTLRKALAFSIIPAVVGWMLMILSFSNHGSIKARNLDPSSNDFTPSDSYEDPIIFTHNTRNTEQDVDPRNSDINLLYISRFLIGLSAGISLVCTPTFLQNFTSNLSSFFQVSLVFGIFMQQLLTSMCTLQTTLILNLMFSCIALLLLTGTIKRTLSHNSDQNSTSEEPVSETFEVCTSSQSPDSPPRNNDSPLLGHSNLQTYKKSSMTTALLVATFQQFCGLNAINFYIQQIFLENETNSILSSPQTYAVLTMFIQFCITAAAAVGLTSSKFSEKQSLSISSLGITLGLSIITIAGLYNLDNLIVMIGAVVFQVMFSIGLGPTTWTIVAGCTARGNMRISALAVALNSLASFLVVFSFYPMLMVLSLGGVFLIYSLVTFLYFIIIRLYFQ